MGLYLLSIVIVDSMVYKTEYCKQQYVWLSSVMCSSLGVISTFGTQLSLFSMTLLSMYRLCEVLNLRVHILNNILIKLAMVTAAIVSASLIIAVGPLMDRYEDLFVNGMTYNPEVKLFLPYVDKQTHLDIIKGYYGRLRMDESFTWKRINYLIDEMFTNDHKNG